MLKVSIITVSFNSKDNIRLMLESIKMQDYPMLESIIVDGGSTDGTLAVIQEFEKKFKGEVKWISEKDHGPYHAINKGIRMATGDIIGCCWDLFSDRHVISKMVNIMEKEHTDGVHGDLVYVGEDGKVIRYWKMGKGIIQKGWMPAHPTLYLRKEVFERHGLYNEAYRCSGDYEFMVRILKDHTCRLSYIPEVLIRMFYGGVSTNGVHAYGVSIKEAFLALCRNRVRFPVYVIFLRIVRTSRQFKMRWKALAHIFIALRQRQTRLR